MKKYNFDKIIDRRGSGAIKYDMSKKYFGSEDLLPMWVADMDFESPDFVLDALKQRLEHPVMGYSHRGPEVNDAAASWLKRQHDLSINTEWLVFSPGVVPGVAMAVQAFTKPGDQIIIQPPVYHPFKHLIEGNHRISTDNELLFSNGRYSINFVEFEQQAKDPKTSMFILCNPHNPVGRAWDKDELNKMITICHENDVLVLSDEIHADLVLPDFEHSPAMKACGPEDAMKIITAIAPSKTFNLAGLASSMFILPDEALRNQFSEHLMIQHLFIGNNLGNIAMQIAWEQGDEWLHQLKQYINGNTQYVRERLETIPGIELVEPEATYLLWLDCRKLGLSDKELKNFMIQKAKLGFNDGPSFGPGGSGFQRMNIACPRAIVEDAMDRLEAALSI